jgi:hypothetical protein
MGGKVLPKLKIISNWNYGELGWNVGMNTNLVKLDTLIQLYVQDKDLSSPPTSPTVGDTYIVGSSATGDWYGYDNYITLYKNIYNDDGSISGQEWVFYDPNEGWICWISDQSLFYYYTGSQWEPLLSSAGYITAADVTYENLNFNGDVGTGSNQVAQGDHNHTGVYLSTSHEGDTVTHGATGVIVGTLNIQTIENKTLTSPVINTPTINTPDIDGGTIDNTSIGSVTPSSGDFTTLTAATDPVDDDGVGDRGYNDLRYSPVTHDNTNHSETYITATDVTYENLNTNSDVGTGSDQVAQGDHEHSVIEDQDGDTTFTYDDNDNILTITKVLTVGTITGTYIETFTYDEDLRVSEMNATLDGADYSKVEYTYDVSGNIVDYTYTRY